MSHRKLLAQHSKTAVIRLPGRKNNFCAYNLARYGLTARRQQSQEGKQQQTTRSGNGGQQTGNFVNAAAHTGKL
jgi:hypothetical protein